MPLSFSEFDHTVRTGAWAAADPERFVPVLKARACHVLRCLVAVALLAGGTLPGRAPAADAIPGDPIAVVLSWDGVRHDYPDRGDFPALARMAREGVRAERLRPVFPSSTFPGHVSLATGTYPDVHGIVGNEFLDEKKGSFSYSGDADWIEAEPLWIAAERQGVPVATYFWVGSESDWRGRGTRYRMAPFDSRRPETEKVDRILAWLALPEAERPRLIMSYWAGADRAGHRHGPDSGEVTAALHGQDAALGRLLAGIDAMELWPRTTLLIVSDHGMTAVSRYLDLEGALADAGIGAVVYGGAVGRIHLKQPVAEERMRTVLEAFLAEVPGARIYPSRALPASYRMAWPGRMGDWVVLLSPPYSFHKPRGMTGAFVRLAGLFGSAFGTHGYDPGLPDMGGIFLAMGRCVPAGRSLAEVRQIDLAATVAVLLGMEPPADSEGAPVWPMPGGRQATEGSCRDSR